MKSSSSKSEKFSDKKFRVKEKALKITVKKNEKFEVEQLNCDLNKAEINDNAQQTNKNGQAEL